MTKLTSVQKCFAFALKHIKLALAICRSNNLKSTRQTILFDKRNDNYIELGDEFGKGSVPVYTLELDEKIKYDIQFFLVVNVDTLSQGNKHVKLEDWVCRFCNRVIYHTVISHSIFPV